MDGGRDLLLVGGGHAHVQVLAALTMERLPGVAVTLVLDRHVAVYSGMLPGLLAGQYRADELELDLRPLARRAGASVIIAPATGLDLGAREVALAGRPPLGFDVASFDVGSCVAGLEVPGVGEHALATRPIGTLVARLGERLERRRPERVVVVGGGAAGVELAFAAARRTGARVTLLERSPRILEELGPSARARVAEAAAARGIELRTGAEVAAVAAQHVDLVGGERLPADLVLWAAGAAALPLFADSGVAHERGFVRVRPTLQLEHDDDVFAAGDCAWFIARALPRSGVHAVRQGPVLLHNLRARLRGGPLRNHRPQRQALALLNLADGRAVGAKWGRSVAGPWVMRWKDAIDRRFVERFQVLDRTGALRPRFPPMPGDGSMACGGCAAKLGPDPLHDALSRLVPRDDPAIILGIAEREDVAAVASAGRLCVSSIDGFRAFTDDPFVVGEVAAVNAASDLWAKGVAPRFAQAWVTVPAGGRSSARALQAVLAGLRAALDPHGVSLVGGHTTVGELAVGLALWGEVSGKEALLRNSALAAGDALLLTKALGTGVLFQADMRGEARGPWIDGALRSMRWPNAVAAALAREAGVRAATDVTGFGLLGHLLTMLDASTLGARLSLAALPLLEGVPELLARGLRSSFHAQNAVLGRRLLRRGATASDARAEVLFDPQTSGGLLLGVAAERAPALLAALRDTGLPAALVGSAIPRRADRPPVELED